MKTIAIDVRLIGRNRTGDEAVFRNLTRELLLLDRENRYLLLTDRRDPEFLAELRASLGVAEHGNAELVPLGGSDRFIWNLFSVPRFLLRRHVDLFHTQYILPLSVPRRTKVVAHIHDVSFRAFPHLIGWKDRLFLFLFIPRTMRRSDCLVAPSEFTKREIVSRYGVDEGKVVVVPNALSPEFLREVSDVDRVRVRRKYGLPERFLLSVGTLQPRKNLPLFLRAFASIRDRVPGVQVVLTGNRSAHHFDRGIDGTIGETHLGSVVVFPGFIETADLPAVYKAAFGLVFPSRYEGFGIPLLEAFASGVPVAASDIPPFREVGGEAAIFFGPDDVAGCADSLYTLLTNEEVRDRLRQLGRERLIEYSWGKSARVLFLRYGQLMEGINSDCR
jgi:glycosyltransferase involved in cell wall biosynthesis